MCTQRAKNSSPTFYLYRVFLPDGHFKPEIIESNTWSASRNNSWTLIRHEAWSQMGDAGCLFNNTIRTGLRSKSLYSGSEESDAMIVVFYNLTPGSGMRHLSLTPLTCSGSVSLKTSIPRIRVSCRVSVRPGLGLQCHDPPIRAL